MSHKTRQIFLRLFCAAKMPSHSTQTKNSGLSLVKITISSTSSFLIIKGKPSIFFVFFFKIVAPTDKGSSGNFLAFCQSIVDILVEYDEPLFLVSPNTFTASDILDFLIKPSQDVPRILDGISRNPARILQDHSGRPKKSRIQICRKSKKVIPGYGPVTYRSSIESSTTVLCQLWNWQF